LLVWLANIYDVQHMLPTYRIYLFVASLTKMVRRYWFKFSHLPCDIFQCCTASMWHWNMRHCKLHVLIGWGDTVGVASHSWRYVIMSWR